ncbi:MAG: ATP-binding cassette domain-containing protein [Cyclobacteriaceae bacterium]|nr:ATP-binding cassette domain-containing protein [Flammeovirgaceae bacterium]
MLTLHRVKKEYHSNLIIQVDQLQFDSGLYWIQGNNGSGKSTLLKVIAGMIPFDGDITVNGIDLRKQPVEYRRRIHYVEAEPLYPPFLTGIDLIAFFTRVRKAKKEEVDFLVQKFKISSFIHQNIGTYSSGMVKKLSLVLAFIGQPAYILLDEPLVTIDKDTVPILYEVIELFAAKGIHFLFTSHQAFDIPSLSHRELLVENHTICFL